MRAARVMSPEMPLKQSKCRVRAMNTLSQDREILWRPGSSALLVVPLALAPFPRPGGGLLLAEQGLQLGADDGALPQVVVPAPLRLDAGEQKRQGLAVQPLNDRRRRARQGQLARQRRHALGDVRRQGRLTRGQLLQRPRAAVLAHVLAGSDDVSGLYQHTVRPGRRFVAHRCLLWLGNSRGAVPLFQYTS